MLRRLLSLLGLALKSDLDISNAAVIAMYAAFRRGGIMIDFDTATALYLALSTTDNTPTQ